MNDGINDMNTSFMADFAKPIRWIGNGFRILAIVVLAVMLGTAFKGRASVTAGDLIAPGIFFAIGELCRFAARRMVDPKGLDMPTVAGAVFMGFGGLMMAGGIVMVFDDPAGFALIGFGLVFVGAGYLARRLFRTPAGMKAVTVNEHTARIRALDGNRGTFSQKRVIYVDANASEAETEAAKRDWLQKQWQRRPDWVAGRIIENGVRQRGVMKGALVLWSLLTVAGVVAGRFWWGGAALIGLGAGIVTALLAVKTVLQVLRQRKFGISELTMKRSPALLGDRLRGEVTTGVRQGTPPRDGFRLRLRCIHSWEETRYDSNSKTQRRYRHHNVLWEHEQHHPGHAGSDRPDRLSVPVEFDLPADQPATTLDRADEGMRWELEISAAVPGLDYSSTFEVPVLDRDSDPTASAK